MGLEIKGNGDVYKVEIRDRGPARVTVKVAPSKDQAGNWKSSFLDLAVWGGPGKDGKVTPGAELVHTLRERDKVTFEAWGKTDSWEKDGKPQTKLAWTVTRLALDGRDTPQRQVPEDDGGSIPF